MSFWRKPKETWKSLIKVWRLLQESKVLQGLVIVIFLLCLFVPVALLLNKLSDYPLNAWTEFVGLAAGVILIDRLRAYREDQQYKKGLIRQARSRANPNAIDAIEIIRENGWLDSDRIRLLHKANLDGTNLSGANLREAYLHLTRFNDQAHLEGADLRNAIALGAEFKNAYLQGARFAGSNLAGVDFSGADLSGCIFVQSKGDSPEEEKAEATFRDGNIARPVRFDGARLETKVYKKNEEDKGERHPHFKNMTLDGTSFFDAKLDGVSFYGAGLTDCNFAGAELTGVSFEDAILVRAKFVENINGLPYFKQVRRINFKKAKLHHAHLENIPFIGVDFQGAELQNADCSNASFSGETNFSGATMTNMTVRGAEFSDVLFDGLTVFFDGQTMQAYLEEIKGDSAEITSEVKALFNARIGTIARERMVKVLTGKVKVTRYARREKLDENGEAITETVPEGEDTIEIRFSGSIAPIDVGSSLLNNLLNEEEAF